MIPAIMGEELKNDLGTDILKNRVGFSVSVLKTGPTFTRRK